MRREILNAMCPWVFVLTTFFVVKSQPIVLSCQHNDASDLYETEKFNFVGGFLYAIEVKGVSVANISEVRIVGDQHWDVLDVFHENKDLDYFLSELYSSTYLDGAGIVSVKCEGNIVPEVAIWKIPFDTTLRIDVVGNQLKSSYSDTCECPLPSYIPRSEWGAAFGLTHDIYKNTASYSDVTHLIVHHSATSSSSGNWAAMVASIFDFHTSVNGWDDIGYNWLIDPDGILYEGRGGGDNVVGAHMCGYNTHTMGVCILGDFTQAAPTAEALNTLGQLLTWKSCNAKLDPLATSYIHSYPGIMRVISGHKDGCAPNYTECPGNNLYDKLDMVRTTTDGALKDCTITMADDVSPYNIDIYPNPVQDILTIHQDIEKVGGGHFKIIDIFGNVMVNTHVSALTNHQIDVSSWQSGTYMILLPERVSKFVKW